MPAMKRTSASVYGAVCVAGEVGAASGTVPDDACRVAVAHAAMASSMSAPGTDAVGAGRVISGSPSMADGEEPGRDHGAARGPGPRRRRRRARGQRPVLRLEQVRDVLHRV